MSKFTNRLLRDAKRQFYARPDVADTYEELRFGGPSGSWVNARELEIVLSFLPPFHRALDLGCGTGRLSRVLAQRGTTIGLDASMAMLTQAQVNNPAMLVQGDVFAIPCANASFDVMVALRVIFHFPNLDQLLREMLRVIAPGGTIIFDTYVWSPRAWFPLDQAHWGNGIFIHSPSQVQQIAQRLGLQVKQSKFCFLFSPYIYRRLPLALVRLLFQLESKIPQRLHARVFWKLERIV